MDIQRAGIWKRMAAWLLDIILVGVLAVGAAWGLSAAFGYDAANRQLEAIYDRYESEYGVIFNITQSTYDAMTEEERLAYDAACVAANEVLEKDEEYLYVSNKVINLTMLITSLGILAGVMVMDFVVPLLLKNGQTLGKKCFGLGLIRNDGVKMNSLQLFTRALLGKYTVGTMIPAYIFLLTFWGALGVLGTVLLGGLAIGQILCMGLSRNNCAIHDHMAGTVVVDLASQQVFDSPEALLEYTKRIHAERARRQDY